LPLPGLKFIGLSKLYRDHEAQMFRLLSKKIAAAEAKSLQLNQADYRSCQRHRYGKVRARTALECAGRAGGSKNADAQAVAERRLLPLRLL
jgi:hypothetical protein